MRRDLVPVPTIGAQGGTMGRPREEPPEGADELIEDLAADGWSVVGIAHKFGVSRDTLRRWLKERPELAEAYAVGRDRERQTLHNEIYRMATGECEDERTKLEALKYLMSRRHPPDPSEDGAENTTRVVITLPAPRPLSDFIDGEVVDGPRADPISA